jgi:hypothetical protein
MAYEGVGASFGWLIEVGDSLALTLMIPKILIVRRYPHTYYT